MAEPLLTGPVGTLSLADLVMVAALFVALSTVVDLLWIWWRRRK